MGHMEMLYQLKVSKKTRLQLIKRQYAIKKIIVENDESQAEKIQNEVIFSINQIKILNNLDHDNIIKYIESFNHKKKFCIVMEYADGGRKYIYVKVIYKV